jgi:hypothetical protein
MLLQVCREFQRGSCTRQPSECRYAHPPDNVTVETCENQVTVCMDFIKGKCTRDSCKYFHPPPHLQAQIKAAQQRANSSTAHALVGFSPRSCQNQSPTVTTPHITLLLVKVTSLHISNFIQLYSIYSRISILVDNFLKVLFL